MAVKGKCWVCGLIRQSLEKNPSLPHLNLLPGITGTLTRLQRLDRTRPSICELSPIYIPLWHACM